jgi:hypothetical protein
VALPAAGQDSAEDQAEDLGGLEQQGAVDGVPPMLGSAPLTLRLID